MAKHSGDIDEGKAFAFLGVFLGIVGFLIVLLTRPKDHYAMFYAKQGLVLTIAMVIISVIAIIPILGWLIFILGWILIVVLWFIGWLNALSGKKKELPILGSFTKHFNF